MREWPSVEFVFATLIVTSYTCVGLLAIWAATSPRHWFVRTTVLLLVLATPLLIPACEPLIVFWLQAAMVIAGIMAWRRWGRTPRQEVLEPVGEKYTPDAKSSMRFSLGTFMLWIPVVAILIAVVTGTARELESQNFDSVTSIALNSFAGGGAVLCGILMFASRRKWIARLAAIVLALAISAILARFDWLFESFVRIGGWPPQKPSAGLLFGFQAGRRFDWAWFAVIPAITISTCLFVWLWLVAALPTHVASTRNADARSLPIRRILARAAVCVLVIIFALPPAVLLWRLSHPLPLPRIPTPEENGFDELVRAGRALDTSPILSTNVEPKSTAELSAEVAKFHEAYRLIESGLTQTIRVRDWPQDPKLLANFDDLKVIQDMRAAARGIVRKAELAQQQGRPGEAAKTAFENVRLGQAISRDALLIDFLVGIAIENMGHDTLYETIPHLNAAESREVIEALSDFDRRREPIDDVIARDRAWSEHAYGWSGRFASILHYIDPAHDDTWGTRQAAHRTQAVTRLLIIEAASRAYQLAHRSPPQKIEQLVPEFLVELPADPFDPDGAPLRYDGGPVAYSVGYDCDDDGGRQIARNEWGGFEIQGDGDLTLDLVLVDLPNRSSASGESSEALTGSTGDSAEPASEEADPEINSFE